MELWLIRHALPIRIDAGDGPADPGLAPAGRDQAERLASWWARFGVDAVYASPMARARETAAPLASAARADLEVVGDLKEFDAHARSYVPIEELRSDPALWEVAVQAWLSPEAEAQRQVFRELVVGAIDGIAARHGGQRVAVVCHGGVINAYLSSVIGLPGTMFFEPTYTSVSRVISGATHRQLVSVNEAPHLGDLVVPATAT